MSEQNVTSTGRVKAWLLKVGNNPRLKTASLAALGIISSVLLALTLIFALRPAPGSVPLENVYQRNFYDLTDTMQQVELKLDKLSLAGGVNLQCELADQLWKDTGNAAIYLDALPISANEITETTRLVNVVGDYVYTLSRKMMRTDSDGSRSKSRLTAQELATIKSLHARCENVNNALQKFRNALGGYRFSDHIDPKKAESGKDSLGGTISGANKDSLPSLEYDGPFSDALAFADFSGLKTKYALLTPEAASTKATQLFGEAARLLDEKEYREIKDKTGEDAKPETDTSKAGGDEKDDAISMDDFYLFSVGEGTVSLSKYGGFPLVYASSCPPSEAQLQVDEAVAKAVEFCRKAYGKTFASVWTAVENDVVMISLAPLENSMYYLTEQVKIKMCLSDGKPCGVDGKTFLANIAKHRGYDVGHGSDLQDRIGWAKAAVNRLLQPVYSRTVVVPRPDGTVRPAFEFKGSNAGKKYRSFVDAELYEELSLFRVVETDMGELVM